MIVSLFTKSVRKASKPPHLHPPRIIWQKEGKSLVPAQAALENWGYKSKSSNGLIILAALKKFILTEDQGLGTNRKIKLSQLALNILWDDREDSTERIAAIKEAALNPKIHRDLWNTYNNQLPSDATLRIELLKLGFVETAIHEFIQEFKETLSFAKLLHSDNMSDHEEDKIPPFKDDHMNPTPDIQKREEQVLSTKLLEFPIIISPTKLGKIQIPYPLTDDEWERLDTILASYKLHIVPSKPKVKKDEDKKEQ